MEHLISYYTSKAMPHKEYTESITNNPTKKGGVK